MQRPNVALTRAKKISFLEELMTEKKKIPGPSDLHKLDYNKPKLKGFYSSSVERFTPADEVMLVKKSIPSSTQYESRGKSMADILKEKAQKFMYQPKADRDLMVPIKKGNDPGPGTY